MTTALDLARKAKQGALTQAQLCRIIDQTVALIRPIALEEATQKGGGGNAAAALRYLEDARTAALDGRMADAILLLDKARQAGGGT